MEKLFFVFDKANSDNSIFLWKPIDDIYMLCKSRGRGSYWINKISSIEFNTDNYWGDPILCFNYTIVNNYKNKNEVFVLSSQIIMSHSDQLVLQKKKELLELLK